MTYFSKIKLLSGRCSFLLALPLTFALSFNVFAESLSRSMVEKLWRDNNPDLKIAAIAISGARGDLAAADRAPNPNFSLSTSQISTRTGIGPGPLPDKSIDSALRLEQTWERGGKRESRSRAGSARVSAAIADAADAERQGLIQLYGAYWDLKLAIERERLSQAAADLARQSNEASAKRLKEGDISGADFAKLQVEALHAENDARSAVADREKAQFGLAVLIRREQDANDILSADDWPPLKLPDLMMPDAAPLNVRLENERFDVQAAKRRIEAAVAARDGAKALATRDITFGVQFEHYPPAAGLSPNNTLGVSVAIPLFASSSYYRGEILRAEADLDTAQEIADRTRAQAKQEVARAMSDLRASFERCDRLVHALLPAAERVAKANEFAYASGGIGLLDLLDARRSLRQIQLEAVTAHGDFAKALSAWQLQFPRALNHELEKREITYGK